MKTTIKNIDGIKEAGKIIRDGGLVAFPTETVYGLGGNALDPEASRKIYSAKGRPSDNPLIVHVAEIKDVYPLVRELNDDALKLMKAFWPGPLTIILPKSDIVPKETTGGLDTVAIRMPENKCTLMFIKEAKRPVAGPSANTSGKPSPTEAEHVLNDLDGKIEMILDDGPVGIGVESTIVDLTGDKAILLRPGAITREGMEEVLKKPVEIDPAIVAGSVNEGVRPKAPGMKYRHYAPEASMYLVTSSILKEKNYELSKDERALEDEKIVRYIVEAIKKSASDGLKSGILCCNETHDIYKKFLDKELVKNIDIKVLGTREDSLSMTHNLFRCLREYDKDKVKIIYAESYSDKGVGFALMNRMRKAAGMNEIIIDQEN